MSQSRQNIGIQPLTAASAQSAASEKNSAGPSNGSAPAVASTASHSPPLRVPMSKGILGFCATSGKAVNCMDARKDWRFDPEVDSQADCPTVSLLVVPVTDHKSQPIAIIQAINKVVSNAPILNPITGGSAANIAPSPMSGGYAGALSPSQGYSSRDVSAANGASAAAGVAPNALQYFSKDEETLLQSMAVSAGVILRKSTLYEQVVATQKRTEALLQISELMSVCFRARLAVAVGACTLTFCLCIPTCVLGRPILPRTRS